MSHDPSARTQYLQPAGRQASAGPHAGSLMRQPAATATANENAISHTFLLWVLRQWWMVIIPAGLVTAAIAGGLVLYLYTPEYEAAALLMIEADPQRLAFPDPLSGRDSQRYVQTQLEMIRDPIVLEPVLDEVGALEEVVGADDPIQHLRKHMAIKQVGQSELYEVKYTSPSPADATKVVNAIIEEYLNLHSGDELQRSRLVIDILEEERRRRHIEVERLRKLVKDLTEKVTGTDPFGGNKVTDFRRAMSPVGSLFQDMTATEVEREMLEAERDSLLGAASLSDDSLATSGLLDLEIDDEPEIRDRELAIKQIEAEMEAVKLQDISLKKDAQAWKANPTYVALSKQLAQLQEDLTDAKSRAREIILARRKEERKEVHRSRIAQIEQELDALNARKELLSKKFDEQVREMQSGQGKSVELEFARAELEREEKVFELIASRKLALQTELRAPARVELKRKAVVPLVALEPVPYKLLFLACSGALVMPFGLAVLREMTVRRISDVDQLAHESRVRVLGEVAALPVRYVAVSPRQLSGRLRRDTYVFAESINSLRTNLSVAEGLANHKVFAVTSAAPSEGKTSVAVSLAMSIANASDEPTLIIDGDMRSPTVASMLKTKNQPGLFELLSNKCTLEEAVKRVGGNNLFVIPGGRATKSTHSVVTVSELKQLLDKLRQQFATIIVDTPPILGASESLLIAKAADSTLFCSLCDVSKSKQVRLAIDRLEHANVTIAGAVLSGMSAKRYEYVYGYYGNRAEAIE